MQETIIATSRPRRRQWFIAPLAASAIGATVFGATRASADTPMAVVTLRDASGHAVGNVRFYDTGHHTVVRARLTTNAHVTAEQFHGFHIHTGADVVSGTSGCIADAAKASTTWFVSAGGHLKADGQLHSNHTGDLESILVNADGSASSTFTTDRFMPGELAGRAIILHAGPDNFGNIPKGTAADQYTPNSPSAITKTDNTGNAGDRVACGVIHVVDASSDH